MRMKIMDDVMSPGLIRAALATWPAPEWPHWHVYDGVHGPKLATKDPQRLTPACQQLMNSLLSWHPVQLLDCEDAGMFPDLELHGAGMHWIRQGGWLSRHRDSNVHPQLPWRRRANAILYLEDCKGGALCIGDKRIQPRQGRVLLFETTDETWHEVEQVLSGERRTLTLFWWDLQEVTHPRKSAEYVAL